MNDKEREEQIDQILKELMKSISAITNLNCTMLGEGGYSVTQFLYAFYRNEARNRILRTFDAEALVMGDTAFVQASVALLKAYPETR